MGTNLLNEIQINTLSSKVKFINKSSEIVTINLYNNKRLFPDFDGGDYIAVNTSSGVGYMYCSSTLYTVSGKTTSNLAFTFKGRDGNIRYVYTKQPNNITESLVTTLTTEVTNYSAIKQEDFPCGGAIYVVSCRGQNGDSGSNGVAYGGGSGGSGGAGGNGWNVKFTPSSFWNITGKKTNSIAQYSTNFDLCTHETYGGGGGGGGGGGKPGYAVGSGGAGGSASPMPPGARVIFPSKTDVVITATKRPGGAGDSGGEGGTLNGAGGNNGGYGGSVSGNGQIFSGEAGETGNMYKGGKGGTGATYNYAWDIERISYTYSYDQVKGVLSIDPYSNGFSNSVTSTSGIVITKFNASYGE